MMNDSREYYRIENIYFTTHTLIFSYITLFLTLLRVISRILGGPIVNSFLLISRRFLNRQFFSELCS